MSTTHTITPDAIRSAPDGWQVSAGRTRMTVRPMRDGGVVVEVRGEGEHAEQVRNKLRELEAR